MIIEAMAMMPGNKRFLKRAEYTSITEYYLPKKLNYVSLVFFHLSLLTNGISMIVQSVQVMDFTIAELFGRTCAVPQFSPEFMFGCPDPKTGFSTVFGDGVYLIPLGLFVTMMVVLPLGMVNLDDNMYVWLSERASERAADATLSEWGRRRKQAARRHSNKALNLVAQRCTAPDCIAHGRLVLLHLPSFVRACVSVRPVSYRKVVSWP